MTFISASQLITISYQKYRKLLWETRWRKNRVNLSKVIVCTVNRQFSAINPVFIRFINGKYQSCIDKRWRMRVCAFAYFRCNVIARLSPSCLCDGIFSRHLPVGKHDRVYEMSRALSTSWIWKGTARRVIIQDKKILWGLQGERFQVTDMSHEILRNNPACPILSQSISLRCNVVDFCSSLQKLQVSWNRRLSNDDPLRKLQDHSNSRIDLSLRTPVASSSLFPLSRVLSFFFDLDLIPLYLDTSKSYKHD